MAGAVRLGVAGELLFIESYAKARALGHEHRPAIERA
jgi:hypothetical protein